MARTEDACALVQVPTETEDETPSTAPAETGPLAGWFNSLPTWWAETTDRVQELSQSTVEGIRKNTAASLRASADALQDASTNTASKMRGLAPWVEGEVVPTVPPARAEDLQKGDTVFRRGLPATFVQADVDALIVRMDDTGNEISTECAYVSLGVEASQALIGKGVRVCLVGLQSKPELNGCFAVVQDFKVDTQRWNVKLNSTEEVVCVNPRNLSACVSFTATEPTSTAPQLEAGAGVRLEGLQNRPQLNGCSGKLVEYQAQTKRWTVKLDNAADVVCVHPRNILVVSPVDTPTQAQL